MTRPNAGNVEQNAAEALSCYGVPWVQTAWLKAGYCPEPLDIHERTIMVIVNGLPELSYETLSMLAAFGDKYGYRSQLLYEGDPQALFDLYGENAKLLSCYYTHIYNNTRL